MPETNARLPGRFAAGRRTWTSVPSMRSRTSRAAAEANISAGGRSRDPGWLGTANPRVRSFAPPGPRLFWPNGPWFLPTLPARRVRWRGEGGSGGYAKRVAVTGRTPSATSTSEM